MLPYYIINYYYKNSRYEQIVGQNYYKSIGWGIKKNEFFVTILTIRLTLCRRIQTKVEFLFFL